MNFQINNFFKLLVPGIELLTLGSQVQRSPSTPRGTPFDIYVIQLYNVDSMMQCTENKAQFVKKQVQD